MLPLIGLSEVRGFLEDNVDKILILIGVTFLTIGLLFLSSLTSLISILGFFFGIIFTATGFLVRTEIIVHNISRAEKMGALLIVTSLVLFAGCFVCFLFRDISRVAIVVPFGTKLRSGEIPRIFEIRIVEFGYPLLWLIVPLFLGALGCLTMGIILKHR